jgi:5S rRNA maturation endonuclease (ribonuclease M5)
MTSQKWASLGRAVTDVDVTKLAASRPESATPSAKTLNEMGFRMGEMGGQLFLVSPYRMGDTFYTLKSRNIKTKEFLQSNSISQKSLFNIDAVTGGCDVYVVESELDAAVLHENGYVAVSVINAKQKQIEMDVMEKLKTAHRIFIVGDQDAPGQVCMNNIAALLPAEKVYRLSFTDAKDVGELAHKIDGEFETFKDRWESIRKGALACWVVRNIPFISQLPSEPQKWVVDRLLPEGCYLLMTGKFGGTKSLTALVLAAGIERGGTVFGRKVTGKTPVLYVDRENPRETIGIRRASLNIPSDQIRYWGDWIDGMETPNLDDPRLAEFAIREKGVIVFDSLTDWLEGESENDPSKMTEISRKFRRLARLGAGVIVLHHDNKNGAGYRGSTAIPAGSDMALKMEKNERTGVVEIRTERFRMCESWEMDIVYDFNSSPWTCAVLKDQSAKDGYRKESADETETVRGVLANHHNEHGGAGLSQSQLLGLLSTLGIGRKKAEPILKAGMNKHWTTKAGSRNSVLYHLIEWKKDEGVL